jgi:hypothetical protein
MGSSQLRSNTQKIQELCTSHERHNHTLTHQEGCYVHVLLLNNGLCTALHGTLSSVGALARP